MDTVTIPLIAKWSSSNTFTAIIFSPVPLHCRCAKPNPTTTTTNECSDEFSRHVLIRCLHFHYPLSWIRSIYISNLLFFPRPPPLERSREHTKKQLQCECVVFFFFFKCTQRSSEIDSVNFSENFSCFYYRRRSLTINRFKCMTISQNAHFHGENQLNRHRTIAKGQIKPISNEKFHR